jgi:hypothetical protein
MVAVNEWRKLILPDRILTPAARARCESNGQTIRRRNHMQIGAMI